MHLDRGKNKKNKFDDIIIKCNITVRFFKFKFNIKIYEKFEIFFFQTSLIRNFFLVTIVVHSYMQLRFIRHE